MRVCMRACVRAFILGPLALAVWPSDPLPAFGFWLAPSWPSARPAARPSGWPFSAGFGRRSRPALLGAGVAKPGGGDLGIWGAPDRASRARCAPRPNGLQSPGGQWDAPPKHVAGEALSRSGPTGRRVGTPAVSAACPVVWEWHPLRQPTLPPFLLELPLSYSPEPLREGGWAGGQWGGTKLCISNPDQGQLRR